MNKKIVYIVLFFILSLIPFVCTFFFQTDKTIENTSLKEFPQIVVTDKETETKRYNFDFLSQLGVYFNDRYAFKSYIVSLDALIQTKVFKTSNINTVVYGKNGWLYYKSSCGDYMNVNTVSKREAFNIAHNISLLQKYVEGNGASFVLTIAPNKNTLYGDNMPYYYREGSGKRSIDLVEKRLGKEKVSYVDLFSAFSSEDEVLYLKRDSHWNNKGAVLAYNEILGFLGKEHDEYLTVGVKREKNENGDLNKILYPEFSENEYNFNYSIKPSFKYVTDTKSVEDPLIETKNKGQSGSLLMFRDSFGNTLLELTAENFGKCCFSKTLPYNVETLLEKHHSDYVIVEKVERNLTDFSRTPPLFSAKEVKLKKKIANKKDGSEINFEIFEDNINYYKISGLINSEIKDNTRIYLSVNDKTYEAFCVSNESTDNAYTLYLKKDVLTKDDISVKLIISESGKLKCISSSDFKLSEFEVK